MTQRMGFLGALSVNVIAMIGIGPLVTIPLVLGSLHGPLSLAAWIAGAVLALCDGLVWAELGSAYPRSGGTYGYFLEAFGASGVGRMLAFLFVWQLIFVTPLTVASGYIGFANYAGYLVPQLAGSQLALKLVAAGVGAVTLIALYRGIKSIEKMSIVLGAFSILALAAVAVAAFAQWSPHLAAATAPGENAWSSLRAGLGPALLIAIYDYIGYNSANLIAGEIEVPHRALPRAIVVAILVVGALYIALQTGVLGAIPWQQFVPLADGSLPPLGQHLSSAIVERVAGAPGAVAVTALILITAFASTFGVLLGGSRVPYAAARDGNFLPIFAHEHAREYFPDVALAVMGIVAIGACFFTLDQVISALTAGIAITQGAGQVVALVVLRARGVRAPYRMWCYPLPALVALAGWIYVFCSAGTPAICFGIVSIVAGIAVYALSRAAMRLPKLG
jgi:amino acid transporter